MTVVNEQEINIGTVLLGLLWLLSGKQSRRNAGNVGLIPDLGRSLGEGSGNLWYSCSRNPVNSSPRRAWGAIVHQFSSVQFSHLVVSDSLRPHGLQHTRLPCPSIVRRVAKESDMAE